MILFFSGSVYAIPGGGAAASSSGLKNAGSMYGLCTKAEGNETQMWMAQGYCQAVDEKLRQAENCNGVQGSLVDAAMAKLKEDELKEFCPGVDLKNDRNKFILFFKQVVAALTIEESDWSDKSTSSMGAQGLMQLSAGSAGGYAKCDKGCERIYKTGKIKGSREANMDNMTCGTTIALVWVAKDGVLGEGSGNKKSRGIARYFQPYRNIDKVKRERMKKKVANYCQKQLNQEPYRDDSSGTVLASIGGTTQMR